MSMHTAPGMYSIFTHLHGFPIIQRFRTGYCWLLTFKCQFQIDAAMQTQIDAADGMVVQMWLDDTAGGCRQTAGRRE